MSAAVAVTIGNNAAGNGVYAFFSLNAQSFFTNVELTAVCCELLLPQLPMSAFYSRQLSAQHGIFRRRRRPSSRLRAPGRLSERQQSAMRCGCLFRHRSCRQFRTAPCCHSMSDVPCFCSQQKMFDVSVRIYCCHVD